MDIAGFYFDCETLAKDQHCDLKLKTATFDKLSGFLVIVKCGYMLQGKRKE